MSDIKLIGWTNYDSSYPNISFDVYPQQVILSLLIEEIKSHQYKFSGADHQNHDCCVPLFSNGKALRCSMRAWGVIMASAYSDKDHKYDYMDFYLDVDDSIYPKKESTIEKAEDDETLPAIIGPDQDIIMESLQMNIPLMSQDKAIKAMYPLYEMKYNKDKN